MKKILPFILLSFIFLYADEKNKEQNSEKDRPHNIDIVGVWDQYIYYYKDGEYAYNYTGTFQILKVKHKGKEEYKMKFVATSKAPELIHSIGVTDIQFDGKVWTFYSDWGEYGIGFFQLEMKDRNVFEGYSYDTDKKKKPQNRLSPNRWIRHDL